MTHYRASQAAALMFDVHFQVNTVGSIGEYTK